MLNDYPMTLGQIHQKIDEDTIQLLTIEGDDFTQIKGLTQIANKIFEKFPEMDLYISSNAHDFGTYYGLEVPDSQFAKWSDIEDESLIIAEELGYEC
jgi:hypothetical protein